MVSLKFEPRTRLMPVKVSLPTEELPVAVPAARSTVTPAVALMYEIRVLPLPVMMSLPPIPSNSLKLELWPVVSVLAPLNPVAT